jgi:predicted O-linked N-acetylglucosamine transferase (SPINDLY family)
VASPSTVIDRARHHYGRFEIREALGVLHDGLLTCDPSPALYAETIFTLEQANRTQDAAHLAARAKLLFPEDARFELWEALILPVLYDTPSEIEGYRARYAAGLRSVAASDDLSTSAGRRRMLEAVANHVNFYLGYQGGDVRDLQEEWGRFVHQVVAANYPEWAVARPMPPLAPDGRIRVGYVSAHFRNHSVAKLFLGWLQQHDHTAFEVFAYHNGRTSDHVTEAVARVAEHFRHLPGELEPICRAVLEDRLHVLVHLDVRHRRMAMMSSLRLAPVQCLAWACPITSGSPNLDYFLSGDAMEPTDGASHYSETLIRLPGIGVCYPRPIIPRPLFRKRRADFGLQDGRTLYLACQSIFKYLPQHDHIFADIAARDPSAQFAFLVLNDLVGEDFTDRLKRAFAARNLDHAAHCVLLPPLGELDYWNLNAVSDVFLDSLEWSGGVTALEAIACGLPIVTLPGALMRGRHSFGILSQLGVHDTIASDKHHYVEIAVRLGRDQPFRAHVLDRMAGAHGRLYGDARCVRKLEDFYRSVVRDRLN